MSTVEARISELGLVLPRTFPAQGSYETVRVHGGLVWVSGHGPTRDGVVVHAGKLGETVSIEEGQQSAELTMLNVLASLKSELGNLDRVTGILKLLILVNATPDFEQPHLVANGASDLLLALYGPRAVHARSAVGAVTLPFGITTEIEAVLAID